MLKKSLFTICLLLGVGSTISAQNNVNVQAAANLENSNCEQNLYCVDLNVSFAQNGSELLGNSSVRFTYDTEALAFSGRTDEINQGSYAAKNFYNESSCGVIKPYAPHSFDGLIAGDFLLSLLLYSEVPQESCTSLISNEWSTVTTVCFDVIDANKDPNFQIQGTENGIVTDLSGTNFNDKSNNPTSKFLNGEFTGLNKTFDTVCAEKGNTGISTVGTGWEIAAVLPIPVRDQLMVNINSDVSNDIDVKIFDLNGKLVKQVDHKVNNGTNQLKLNVSDFAAGAYILSITKGEERLSQKFVKE